jgi:hypothetical protein
MQNACEEVVLSLGPADVDNGGISSVGTKIKGSIFTASGMECGSVLKCLAPVDLGHGACCGPAHSFANWNAKSCDEQPVRKLDKRIKKKVRQTLEKGRFSA